MKTFYMSLAVFVTMLSLIIWNARHVHSTASTLTAQLDAIPECAQADSGLDALLSFWESKRTLLALSTSYEEISALDDCIAAMRTANELDEKNEYAQSRAMAYNVIARIERTERLTADSIL